MSRSNIKLFNAIASAAILLGVIIAPGQAMNLVAPVEGQNVRETVRIKIPASDVPDDGFIAIYAGESGQEQFIKAIDAKSARKTHGVAVFTWNTKSPYRDSSDARTLKYHKDGNYSLKVEVHDASAKTVKSAAVNVFLKNQVPRSNPAPAVSLKNRLAFGQSNTYAVHSNVQVFDAVGLPVLGGMGMSSDFKVLQSVEDVRDNGELLLRYTIGDKAVVTSFGKKRELYKNDEIKPQLYRLIDKYGDVLKANLFSKQGRFTIMDILPMLPKKHVKEGDTWPTSFSLKIEGLTQLTKFTGTSMLDSFEWQNGRQCVKIISNLVGKTRIDLLGGKIRSSSNNINAQAITYFSYKTGKMMAREITLEFPVNIEAGAESYEPTGNDDAFSGAAVGSPMPGVPSNDDEDNPGMPGAGTSSYPYGGYGANNPAQSTQQTSKKGSVQINISVALEK